jgi:glutamate-5-semialdehyde dehydrogenase
MNDRLERLVEGMPIPYGGDRITAVPAELAKAFQPGDRLIVVQDDGALLHIPAAEWAVATEAVGKAHAAFGRMGLVAPAAVSEFFSRFADRLEDDPTFAPIAEANAADVELARARGRSTTRLVLSEKMRADMVSGLRTWAALPDGRGEVLETVHHGGWRAELVKAGLGVVGFVFEGRPNVFADACGVLRSGNTVVFRIGSDALGTARAIVGAVLAPAAAETGLPAGAVSLVDSPLRAAGWAMFSDRRLALAVARGSGPAVAQLGAVARQAGTPVSLHGTGGAWIVAADDAAADDLATAVFHSLDRKVCNTLNTCCLPAVRAAELVPAFLSALERAAARRGTNPKLHVAIGQTDHIPAAWFEPRQIARAAGLVVEPGAEALDWAELGTEWEWEDSPEVTLALVDSVDHAVALFNATSPRFVASLIGGTPTDRRRFFETIDAPFVGNGFTRWVDGQYALGRPELGLSNWQHGRLFGRGGVLSGDSVFTVRTRVTQDHLDIGR